MILARAIRTYLVGSSPTCSNTLVEFQSPVVGAHINLPDFPNIRIHFDDGNESVVRGRLVLKSVGHETKTICVHVRDPVEPFEVAIALSKLWP